MSSPVFSIGPYRSAYAERVEPALSSLDEMGIRLAAPISRWRRARSGDAQPMIDRANELEAETAQLGDAEIPARARGFGARLASEGATVDVVAGLFAIIREAAHRQLGKRHYDVQLAGGWVMLNGMLAEMVTGEGKTLTATLPAAAAALSGLPVHLITVNDYLAARDAEELGPVYRALGLRVGLIQEGMTPNERRDAYAADITYCTNKELAFDYLKDRITLGSTRSRTALRIERLAEHRSRSDELLLRGLCFAIVDEADSVLIDEARTPLIISASKDAEEEEELYETALELAAELEEGVHFSLEQRERGVRLSEAGEATLESLAESLGGIWSGPRRRADLVRQALSAIHLFERDTHYIVEDEEIQIVDEFTGRRMADRSWERGLHQMIEMKEGCPPTARRETLARISYQRFFRRYAIVAGMTGTAHEVRNELWATYGLAVVPIPTHRPVRREILLERIFETRGEKWAAVIERIAAVHDSGRPVLVGTASVEASEALSEQLDELGLSHRVLNARQDQEEAEIVADAGRDGRITVATNMAGRGTDIVLDDVVRERGGLHVIATTRHEAARIDRQLLGRCGRQGDPGSFESLISLEDELVQIHASPWTRAMLGNLPDATGGLSRRVKRWSVEAAQGRAERYHSKIRMRLLEDDRKTDSLLSFSGVTE